VLNGGPARVAAVIIAAVLSLTAAGCGGAASRPDTQIPSPSPGRASASPHPGGTTTAPGPGPSSAASRAPGAPAAAPPGPAFRASTLPLTAAMRARMTGVSWHQGCPVGLDELRSLRLS
jgi:hypothetical protein